MVFQRGAFLYLNKGIVINGKLLLPIGNKVIKKYRIDSLTRERIKKTIAEEPRYSIEPLMDPYSYFRE